MHSCTTVWLTPETETLTLLLALQAAAARRWVRWGPVKPCQCARINAGFRPYSSLSEARRAPTPT